MENKTAAAIHCEVNLKNMFAPLTVTQDSEGWEIFSLMQKSWQQAVVLG